MSIEEYNNLRRELNEKYVKSNFDTLEEQLIFLQKMNDDDKMTVHLNIIIYGPLKSYIENNLYKEGELDELQSKRIHNSIINLMRKYPNDYFKFLNVLNNDKPILSFKELKKQKNIFKYTAEKLQVSTEFIYELYFIDKEISVGSDIGKGELFLSLFFKLYFAEKRDLKNKYNEYIEVKDNGVGNAGFRFSLPVAQNSTNIINNFSKLLNHDFTENVKNKLTRKNKSFNINNPIPLNSTNSGDGLSIEDIFNVAVKQVDKLNIQQFIEIFYGTPNNYKYNKEQIENKAKEILIEGNYKKFKSFIGFNNFFISNTYLNIKICYIFYNNGTQLEQIIFDSDYNELYDKYAKNFNITTLETQDRNKCIRTQYKK